MQPRVVTRQLERQGITPAGDMGRMARVNECKDISRSGGEMNKQKNPKSLTKKHEKKKG